MKWLWASLSGTGLAVVGLEDNSCLKLCFQLILMPVGFTASKSTCCFMSYAGLSKLRDRSVTSHKTYGGGQTVIMCNHRPFTPTPQEKQQLLEINISCIPYLSFKKCRQGHSSHSAVCKKQIVKTKWRPFWQCHGKMVFNILMINKTAYRYSFTEIQHCMPFWFSPLEIQELGGDSNVTSGISAKDFSTKLFLYGT